MEQPGTERHHLHQPQPGQVHAGGQGQGRGREPGAAQPHRARGASALLPHGMGLPALPGRHSRHGLLPGAHLLPPHPAAGIAEVRTEACRRHREAQPGQAAFLHQHLPRVPHPAHAHHRADGDAVADALHRPEHLQQDTESLQEQPATEGTDHRTAGLPQAGTRLHDHQGERAQHRGLRLRALPLLPGIRGAAAHHVQLREEQRLHPPMVRRKADAEGNQQPDIQRLQAHSGRGTKRYSSK